MYKECKIRRKDELYEKDIKCQPVKIDSCMCNDI